MQRTRARFGLLLGALTLVGASAGLATSGASASGEPVEIGSPADGRTIGFSA